MKLKFNSRFTRVEYTISKIAKDSRFYHKPSFHPQAPHTNQVFGKSSAKIKAAYLVPAQNQVQPWVSPERGCWPRGARKWREETQGIGLLAFHEDWTEDCARFLRGEGRGCR